MSDFAEAKSPPMGTCEGGEKSGLSQYRSPTVNAPTLWSAFSCSKRRRQRLRAAWPMPPEGLPPVGSRYPPTSAVKTQTISTLDPPPSVGYCSDLALPRRQASVFALYSCTNGSLRWLKRRKKETTGRKKAWTQVGPHKVVRIYSQSGEGKSSKYRNLAKDI